MSERRWFVTKPGEGYQVEDVGADGLSIIDGCLVFYNEYSLVSFAYAPGTWMFVEFQE